MYIDITKHHVVFNVLSYIFTMGRSSCRRRHSMLREISTQRVLWRSLSLQTTRGSELASTERDHITDRERERERNKKKRKKGWRGMASKKCRGNENKTSLAEFRTLPRHVVSGEFRRSATRRGSRDVSLPAIGGTGVLSGILSFVSVRRRSGLRDVCVP